MAASDSWDLQGMNGGVAVAAGQTFSGLSRCVQVWQAGDLDVGLVNPAGATVTVSLTGVAIGTYLRGPISSVAPSTGVIAVVYPVDLNYTVA